MRSAGNRCARTKSWRGRITLPARAFDPRDAGRSIVMRPILIGAGAVLILSGAPAAAVAGEAPVKTVAKLDAKDPKYDTEACKALRAKAIDYEEPGLVKKALKMGGNAVVPLAGTVASTALGHEAGQQGGKAEQASGGGLRVRSAQRSDAADQCAEGRGQRGGHRGPRAGGRCHDGRGGERGDDRKRWPPPNSVSRGGAPAPGRRPARWPRRRSAGCAGAGARLAPRGWSRPTAIAG
jgi:hypothetical protein